jgi:hypothetical protein
MIKPEKQYEYLTTQIGQHPERRLAIFKLFIQTFAAIVAGSVYLAVNIERDAQTGIYLALLSGGIGLLLAAVCCAMIWANLRTWFRHREAQSKLAASAPKPKYTTFAYIEFAMMFGLILSAVLFIAFNPFSFIAPKPMVASQLGQQVAPNSGPVGQKQGAAPLGVMKQ